MSNDFTAKILRVHTRDVDAVLARVSHLYGGEVIPQIIAEPEWSAEVISLGPITLVNGAIDNVKEVSFAIGHHSIAMNRVGTAAVRTPHGISCLAPGVSAVVVSPGHTITVSYPPEMRTQNLIIDQAFMISQLEALTGERINATIDFQSSLDLSIGAGAFLHHTTQYLVDAFAADARQLPSVVIASLCESILRTLLASHPNTHSYLLDKPAPPSSRTVVRRIEEYIDAHAGGPIQAQDLAKIAGTGMASVEAAFKQHRGLMPMAFLKQRRLERARRVLLDDPQISILRAAHLAGYLGIEPFEAAYFKQFRETPADTRRKACARIGAKPLAPVTMTAAERIALLTEREREVIELVARGFLNKQIADVLGIAHKTVDEYRAKALRKLDVQSVADLVRLWDRQGV